jgi:hypothetical protein
VTVKAGSRTVASKTVIEGHTYLFVVQPGHYTVHVELDRTSPAAPADPHAGGTEQVNLVSTCQ